MQIRKGDTVEVTTGDDRGVRAKVVSVDRRAGKVVVEGVNLVYKHVRRSQKNPQGGRLSKEMPVSLSNVILVCEKCNRASRIGIQTDAEGAKHRYCKKCGARIGQVSPAKKGRAKQRA